MGNSIGNTLPMQSMQKLSTEVSAVAERWVNIAVQNVINIPDTLSKMVRPKYPQVADIIAAIQVDSPVILVFTFITFMVQVLSVIFGEDFNITYFSIWPYSNFYVLSPLSHWRLLSHVVGHESWQHLQGNLVHLLLVGPACEREYGAYPLLLIMLWTAIASAIAHMFLGGQGVQLGASGVVFMLILLNSLLEKKKGAYVPLTFILQVWIWVYKEIMLQIFAHDSISHIAHIVGALVGSIAGYELHGAKVHKRTESFVLSWYRRNIKAKKISDFQEIVLRILLSDSNVAMSSPCTQHTNQNFRLFHGEEVG